MGSRRMVRRVVVVLAALMMVFALPALADLPNGSFETPVIQHPDGWDIGTGGAIWSVEWTDPGAACTENGAPPLVEFQKSGVVVTAHQGNQYAELDSDCGGPDDNMTLDVGTNVRISQTLNLAKGNYSLKYAWQQRTASDAMEVAVNGNVLATESGAGAQTGWNTDSRSFDASGSTTLSFAEAGPADTLGMFLDSVCLICNNVEYNLIAGQHHDAGSILVWDDGTNLFVKFVADDPWKLKLTHLAVGWSEADIPQNNGNPPPGQFPYQRRYDPPVSMDTYIVPFSEILGSPDGSVVIAAHAEVTGPRGETAWGSDGICEFDGRNWAKCIEYIIGDCDIRRRMG